jgi:ketosteroid isomerase-like protein
MAFTVTEAVAAEAAHSWQLRAERIAGEADDRVRRNLEIVARHVVAEVRGDIEALMATLVPEPAYELFGAGPPWGPKGAEAVRAFYETSNEAGQNRLEFELCRVVADRDCVVTEGVFRHAFSGVSLVQLGLEYAEPAEPEGWYLVQYPAIVAWVISPSGLIEGERIYFGDLPRVLRKLAPGESLHLGPVSRGWDSDR